MRTKSILLLILFFSLTIFLSAGEKPDFSGNWKLNKEKSEITGEGRFIPTKLEVTQDKEKISIDRIIERQYEDPIVMGLEVTLDGKENSSEVWGGSPRVATANWGEKGVLTIDTNTKFTRDGTSMDITSNEVWQLKDGMLVVNSSVSSPRGDRTYKLVFEKEIAKEKTEK